MISRYASIGVSGADLDTVAMLAMKAKTASG